MDFNRFDNVDLTTSNIINSVFAGTESWSIKHKTVCLLILFVLNLINL